MIKEREVSLGIEHTHYYEVNVNIELCTSESGLHSCEATFIFIFIFQI